MTILDRPVEKITLEPLTEEEKRQALAVLREAREIRKAILKRRRGKLVPSSTPLIRAERERRSNEL